MMKSRLSLKNLVRAALNSLKPILIILLLFSGCSSSTAPTYLKQNLDKAVRDICKNEYKFDVKTKLAGATLWIYLPVEDFFVKTNKTEKRVEIFDIKKLKTEFNEKSLEIAYAIKNIPPKGQEDNYEINKTVSEKLANIWKVIRRVLFSMKHSPEDELKFFCIITADTKNGFEIKTTSYFLDLKKVFYGLISFEEYRHRSIQETNIDLRIIDDKEGKHIKYKDITMKDFITGQIQHRIKLKFQVPEVNKNADIDKEILKIITSTIKIYNFKDFNDVDLKNLLTNNKIMLNKAALWARPAE